MYSVHPPCPQLGILGRSTAMATVALTMWGCSGNEAPVMSSLSDQQAWVNTELAMVVRAGDADGDRVSFSFSSDVPNLEGRARLEASGEGQSTFRWTPLISDVGSWSFDFTASDGEESAHRVITIDVSQSGEGSTAPVFIQPLGSGSTIDVTKHACLELDVVVQDNDSTSVELGQQEPIIAGATLTQTGDLTGSWSLCPTKEQIATDDRYTLALSANDFDNAPTIKDYLIVLRSGSGENCPGEAPSVSHTPDDVSSVNDITITATVSDDLGIKYEPLLYYSTAPPGDPPDVTQMTQLTMALQSGDLTNGVWSVDVPNPVASQGTGSSGQLYYLLAAQDNDDTSGSCDHLTQVPDQGAFAITVSNPGGSGGLDACASCTADVQCGGSDDLCIFLGGSQHCGIGCTASSECPSGYYCSFASLDSIDNASGRQCIPNDYQCDAATSSCTDDSYEDNDTLAQAAGGAALSTGSYGNLKSCPADTVGDDEDWYRIELSGDATISAAISGGNNTDLDLALTDASGVVLEKSDSLSSNESVSSCLPAGSYYLHVFAYGEGDNSYTLDYSTATGSCAGECVDDTNEDDDDAVQARVVDLNSSPYTSPNQAICAWDDDWYEVLMYSGETLYATLEFLQTNAAEDLDIYLFDSNLNDLTGCNESAPFGCDPFNGGSGTSNETLSWPIAATGDYYLVVHGWAGSENTYDICVGLSAAECP